MSNNNEKLKLTENPSKKQDLKTELSDSKITRDDFYSACGAPSDDGDTHFECESFSDEVFPTCDSFFACNNIFDCEVIQALYSLGVSSNLRGFIYLLRGVELSLSDREYLNLITKRLYPEIAKLHFTTPMAVERAIRYARKKIFSRDEVNNLFFSMNYNATGCTNSELIAMICDYITLHRN